MANESITFDNAEAYEQYIGKWSRSAGEIFLDWIASKKSGQWLDVGCGTGAFTELILKLCDPASVVAIDPSAEQINYARKQEIGSRADFRIADATDLPFPDSSFDFTTAALVINFIPDRPRALTEMRRVTRGGGMVCGYVWDLGTDRSISWPLASGMRAVGMDPPGVVGTDVANIEALRSLFEDADLEDIDARAIQVTRTFADFDDYWQSQTPSFAPIGKLVGSMSEPNRERLRDAVRHILPRGEDGSITYWVRANAIRARVPG